jgi:hypothetical protein
MPPKAMISSSGCGARIRTLSFEEKLNFAKHGKAAEIMKNKEKNSICFVFLISIFFA